MDNMQNNVAFLLFDISSDNTDDRDLPLHDSDNEGVEEVEMEDEELWRRMRYEREIFLQQQKVCTNFINGQGLEDTISHPRKISFVQKYTLYSKTLPFHSRIYGTYSYTRAHTHTHMMLPT